jgi:uncharacterized protein YihD (DUF1040 family)
LDNLSQDIIVEQIKPVQEDPKAVVPGLASVEEDLKVLDIIIAQTSK